MKHEGGGGIPWQRQIRADPKVQLRADIAAAEN